MFLKSIDLFGFKSFAEKRHIRFTDGISALIGPNGCGKSNVVDAVKWVLGEQATKNLRAERMEDVIFNGTDSRKSLNVAEVTLTLENDGVLPLDVPEITVRRRLFRSGESEFFINGAPVKLKDVRELFYDTGIGKSAYSIMEQGKIDQILSKKPEDRRSLFEEAAGITRHKMRRREADRKLERTEANMHEVASVLSEVKRSYDSLNEQAKKTEQYRTLRDQLFELELDLQLARLSRFREQREGADKRYEKLDGERNVLKKEIDRLNERLETEFDRLNKRESRLVEVQKTLYGIDVEKHSRIERISLIKEQLDELHEHVRSEAVRMESLDRKAGELRSNREETEKSVATTQGEIDDIGSGIRTVRERIDRNRERQHEARATMKRHDERIFAHDTEVDERQRELREVTDQLVTALDGKLRESGYSSTERQRREAELRRAMDNHEIVLRGRKESLPDRVRLNENPAERVDAVTAAFGAIDASWREVGTAVDLFNRTIPRFLDDFLAPEGTITKKRSLDERIETFQERNRALRQQNQELAGEITSLEKMIDSERGALEQMRLNRVQLQGRADSLIETSKHLRRESEDIQRRKKELEKEISRSRTREIEMDASVAILQKEHCELEAREKALRDEVASLEKGIAADNKNLKSEERNVKEKLRVLAHTQEQREEVQVERTEKRTEIKGLYESFSERHGRDLREFEKRTPRYDGDQKKLREVIASVRGTIKNLGSVNLMAVEEFAEISDRYEFLHSQIEDLSRAEKRPCPGNSRYQA